MIPKLVSILDYKDIFVLLRLQRLFRQFWIRQTWLCFYSKTSSILEFVHLRSGQQLGAKIKQGEKNPCTPYLSPTSGAVAAQRGNKVETNVPIPLSSGPFSIISFNLQNYTDLSLFDNWGETVFFQISQRIYPHSPFWYVTALEYHR